MLPCVAWVRQYLYFKFYNFFLFGSKLNQSGFDQIYQKKSVNIYNTKQIHCQNISHDTCDESSLM